MLASELIFLFCIALTMNHFRNIKSLLLVNNHYKQKSGTFSKLITRQFSSPKNFLTNIIEEDLAKGKNGKRVITRFPPEPNGYLHLGHAKAIYLNFGLATEYGGHTHMRLDDTNPETENNQFALSILEDVKWLLGGSIESSVPWYGPVRHASDYFQTMYDAAEYLIAHDLAYVDHLSQDEVRQYRGTLTVPGKDSPFRCRSVEENIDLFRKMKDGYFNEGNCVLRAKIDMKSSNLNMRDPPIYRIKQQQHPKTGKKWNIYPMYDFAHVISDAIENITHSLCSLEFENHRPLYDWILDKLKPSGLLPNADIDWRPHQYEFSRLNLQFTVLSKRKLIQLVEGKYVDGWDDPRLPTICGLRRRGFPCKSLQLFCDRIGVSKAESNIDYNILEDCAREVLDADTPRAFAIQNPLKLVLTNWDQINNEEVQWITVDNHPKTSTLGVRTMPFSPNLYIDRADFFDCGKNNENKPPKGYKRLMLGSQVRLKYAYAITCQEVVRDDDGNICELKCTFDPESFGGKKTLMSSKAKAAIQWISAHHGISCQLNLYDRLFLHPNPSGEEDFLKLLNPQSLQVINEAIVEHSLVSAAPNSTYQFERMGYFIVDTKCTQKLNFNRIVSLKDTWVQK